VAKEARLITGAYISVIVVEAGYGGVHLPYPVFVSLTGKSVSVPIGIKNVLTRDQDHAHTSSVFPKISFWRFLAAF